MTRQAREEKHKWIAQFLKSSLAEKESAVNLAKNISSVLSDAAKTAPKSAAQKGAWDNE